MAGSDGLYFMESFDHYDGSNADLAQKWGYVDANASYDNTVQRNGVACALLDGASGLSKLGFDDLGTGPDHVTLAGAFRIDGVGAQPADPNTQFLPDIAQVHFGPDVIYYLTINSTGSINVEIRWGGSQISRHDFGTVNVVATGWHYIEWVIKYNHTDPSEINSQLWVDDVPYRVGLETVISDFVLVAPTEAYFSGAGGTVYLDDVYVCDEATTITTDKPNFGGDVIPSLVVGHLGDVDIQVLYPDTTGDSQTNPQDWTPSAALGHSTLVDEVPGDVGGAPAVADNVFTSTIANEETFGMDDPTTNGEAGWRAIQGVVYGKTAGAATNLMFLEYTSGPTSATTTLLGPGVDLFAAVGTADASGYSYHTMPVPNLDWPTGVNGAPYGPSYTYAEWANLAAQCWGFVHLGEDTVEMRVAQFCLEVAAPLDEPPAQLSQLVVEIARPLAGLQLQLSQLVLEIAQSSPPIVPDIMAQLSQFAVEVALPFPVGFPKEVRGKKPLFYECIARDNGGAGFDCQGIFVRCLAARNGTDGFIDPITIVHGVTYGNTLNGVSFSHGRPATLIDLVNVNNAVGYSFDETAAVPYVYLIRCSDTGNTTRLSGNTDSVIIEEDGRTLTADPFTDAANNDFTLDADGVELLGSGVQFHGLTASESFHDHQAWQEQCGDAPDEHPFTDTMVNRSVN